jgi:DNA-binding Lrp family transcriptional regulator
MKKIMMKLLSELLKDSSRSDRKLGKILGVSQPTVSRTRNKLVKDEVIQQFTIIPDLSKMGYEIVAFTLLKFSQRSPELIEKGREWAKRQPNVIFAGDGEGAGMDAIMISVHKNYACLTRLIDKLRLDWQPDLKKISTFISSASRPELIVKPFSLKYIAELHEK